jgi:hypothetical protein
MREHRWGGAWLRDASRAEVLLQSSRLNPRLAPSDCGGGAFEPAE